MGTFCTHRMCPLQWFYGNGELHRCQIVMQQKRLAQNCWTFLGITSSLARPTSVRVRINGLCRSSFVNLSTSELYTIQFSTRPDKWKTNGSRGYKSHNYLCPTVTMDSNSMDWIQPPMLRYWMHVNWTTSRVRGSAW
jgi:hypothetical protein